MSTITARPWKLLKCPCGHPSCQQYQFANQGSYGLDKDDAEFALRAINAFDAMVEALEEAQRVLLTVQAVPHATKAAALVNSALALARGER